MESFPARLLVMPVPPPAERPGRDTVEKRRCRPIGRAFAFSMKGTMILIV
jgi:hypothetical protein